MIITGCVQDCHAITEAPLYMYWSLAPTFALQNEIMYHSSGRGVTREAIQIYRGDDDDDEVKGEAKLEVDEAVQSEAKTTTAGTGTTTTTTASMTSTPKITVMSGETNTMTGSC